jgi:hypothetical protein
MKKRKKPVNSRSRFIDLFPLPIYLYLIIPVFFVLLSLFFAGGQNRVSLYLYDSLLWFREPVPESEEIVFLDIDDTAIEYQGEWPWHRTDLARYLMELDFFQPKSQILDINFDLPNSRGLSDFLTDELIRRGFPLEQILSSTEDPVFGNMLASINQLEVASFFDNEGSKRVLSDSIGFENPRSGFVNKLQDQDGIIRRFTPRREDEWILGLSSFLASNPERQLRLEGTDLILSASGQESRIPLLVDGSILIEWPRTDYPQSFSHVGFEILPRIVELRDVIWNNTGLLDAYEIFPEDGSVKQALQIYDDALSSFLSASFNGDPEGLESYFLLRTAAEDLLRSNLSDRNIGTLLQSLDQNQFVLSGEVQLPEVAIVLEQIRTDLARLSELQDNLRNSIEDRYVIVAYSTTASTDRGSNPFISDYVNAGMFGSILNMLLLAENQQYPFLQVQNPWITLAVGLILTVLLALIIRKKPVLFSLLFLFLFYRATHGISVHQCEVSVFIF